MSVCSQTASPPKWMLPCGPRTPTNTLRFNACTHIHSYVTNPAASMGKSIATPPKCFWSKASVNAFMLTDRADLITTCGRLRHTASNKRATDQ